MNKKIKEVTGASATSGFSAAIGTSAQVHPIDPERGRTFGRAHAKKGAKPKKAVLPSEEALRETLRKIIFLNKVKFYEEKAKVAMNENKLRKVIRFLLREEEDPFKANLKSTGQVNAWEALSDNITNIKNGFNKLITSKKQREGYIETFYNGVVDYLDKLKKIALGQELPPPSPDEKPKSELTPPSAAVAPEETPELTSPEGELSEADEVPETGAVETESPEETARKEKEAEAERKRLAASTVSALEKRTETLGVDPTGASEARDVLNTILPIMGARFSACKDDKDKQDFIDFLIGPNGDRSQSWIISTVNGFEAELNSSNPKTTQG